MTCKDCVHYEVCVFYSEQWNISMWNASPQKCHMFKDKSKFIELLCKVGDTVYELTDRGTISEYKITGIRYRNYLSFEWELIDGFYSNLFGFLPYSIGKTVFLTKEEAEKALKEREENEPR